MNVLETVETADGVQREPWFGGCLNFDASQETNIFAIQGPAGIVYLCAVGYLTTKAQLDLARLIDDWSGQPETRGIVLTFSSWAGEVRGLQRLENSIRAARESVKVAAHLHIGCGVAYYAATFCEEIWSAGHEPVGLLGYLLPDDAEISSVANTFGEANRLAWFALLDARPQLDADATMNLFYHVEPGEAAELHGLVDGLKTELLTAADLGLQEASP